jgi:hypothetical protein
LVTSVPLSPTEKWIVSSSASDPPPALMIHQLNYPWRLHGAPTKANWQIMLN